MSSVDFLIKLRDAAIIVKDACEEQLEKTAPVEAKGEDYSKLFWEEKEGTKGKFQQTSEKANNNSDLWKKLQAKLKGNKGFWQNSGFKYWFDRQNETVIDRRKVA
jgi:hypothetical protein